MDRTKQKKIGIMGGTFDPIHYGHLLIAQSAADEFKLDKVLFVPTGKSPHKQTELVTEPEIRCEMVKLAIASNEKFVFSDIEIKNSETNYTYLTLQRLSEQYPDAKLYFIMGGDSLKEFKSWREPARICSQAVILAAVRDEMIGQEMREAMEEIREIFHAEIFMLHSPNFSVSSHSIRERLEKQYSVRYLVPDEVLQFIYKEKIYAGERL
ncbi:MAG: nicotinate-nucleotide adenylyltransferase [Roseburia sp.]|nr:nicotinate-nucleotide adenylyltransferase [Roseburia sp.]